MLYTSHHDNSVPFFPENHRWIALYAFAVALWLYTAATVGLDLLVAEGECVSQMVASSNLFIDIFSHHWY